VGTIRIAEACTKDRTRRNSQFKADRMGVEPRHWEDAADAYELGGDPGGRASKPANRPFGLMRILTLTR
jgi:hypothetical protein